jgi:hypothetical protein
MMCRLMAGAVALLVLAVGLAAQAPARVVVLSENVPAAGAPVERERQWPRRLAATLAGAEAACEVIALPWPREPLALQELRALRPRVLVLGGSPELRAAWTPLPGVAEVWVGLPQPPVAESAASAAGEPPVALPAAWSDGGAPTNVGGAYRAGLALTERGHDALAHLVAHAVLVKLGVNCRSPQVPLRGVRTLDLSADATRVAVVDREPGQYLGHPTTTLLADGQTLWCVYPKGHGKGAIVLKRSGDGGKTWSERLPTPASWATSLETPTLYQVAGPTGPRLLLFSGLRPVRLAHSDDLGATWSELAPIFPHGGIVAMASLAQRPDRTLVAWFHDDGRFLLDPPARAQPPVFSIFQTTSADAGRTWSTPTPIVTDARTHPCEPGFVASPDGKRWALLLRENRRVGNSMVVFSNDQGATWSVPQELPATLTGDRHVARYAPDGRLVITFRDMAHASPTWGDWVVWVGSWQDVLDGGEGQMRVRLADNTQGSDCAYPGLELLPDGTFVATTYGHWQLGQPPYVIAVRFTLAEFDERAR